MILLETPVIWSSISQRAQSWQYSVGASSQPSSGWVEEEIRPGLRLVTPLQILKAEMRSARIRLRFSEKGLNMVAFLHMEREGGLSLARH